MLRLNTIYPQPGSSSARKRLGRGQGSGLGKTAGKGHKGQLARTGGVVRAGFEGGQTPLYRRLPKRGFTNFARRRELEMNVSDLNSLNAPEVSLSALIESKDVKGHAFDRLVILGNGELKKAVVVKAHRISASAQEKIKKAGGSFELLPIPGVAERHLKKNKKK